MIEQALNHVVSIVQTTVSWLGLIVKIENAALSGLNHILEELKFKE